MSSSMFKNGFNCRLKWTQSLIPRSLSISENLLKGWRPYKAKASRVFLINSGGFLKPVSIRQLAD
jgi:hypothetical protein